MDLQPSTSLGRSASRPKRTVNTGAKNYEVELEELIEDCFEEPLMGFDSDDSDIDLDYAIESAHNSDSEQEMSGEENQSAPPEKAADEEVVIQDYSTQLIRDEQLVQDKQPVQDKEPVEDEESDSTSHQPQIMEIPAGETNHIDEIIQSVIDGAGEPMDICEVPNAVRMRGSGTFFYGK